jgi:hypothetical protein
MTVSSKPTQTKRKAIAECGTISGHRKHFTDKTSPCQPCRDARSKYRSAYYKAHPEKKRAMDIRYQENHPGQRNKYDQKYRDNNRDKTRAATLNWQKENPEKNRETSRKRRALKLDNGHTPYTELQVLETYGVICYLCNSQIDLKAPRRIGKEGWQLGLHIDHVVPIIAGGPDTLENVRPSHAICNTRKGEKMADDFEADIDPSLFEEDFEDVELEDFDDHALDELEENEEEEVE